MPFRGIVDRLDEEGDGLVVTDYKSGKARRPGSVVGASIRCCSVAAVEQATGEMPVHARLLYLGQRPVGIKVTREEIDSVVDKLAGTWAAINTACDTDEFEPRTGPLCGAPCVDRCPEGTKEVAKRPGATPTPLRCVAATNGWSADHSVTSRRWRFHSHRSVTAPMIAPSAAPILVLSTHESGTGSAGVGVTPGPGGGSSTIGETEGPVDSSPSRASTGAGSFSVGLGRRRFAWGS